jgi:hypothetical protein
MRTEFERIADYYLADNHGNIPQPQRDEIAEKLTLQLMVEFDRDGQRHRWPARDELGNPRCSYCGAMGFNDGKEKPLIPPGHPQYGIFCTCTEPLAGESS